MWSTYLLKYTLKAEAIGPITLDSGVTSSLGMDDISVNEARLVSAMVFSQPWSVAEAALHLAGIPLVNFTEPVEYVTSMPYDYRKMYVSKGAANLNIAPVEKYMARPSALADCTFTRFFKKHLVTKETRKLGVGAHVGDAIVASACFHVYQRKADAVVRFSDPHHERASESFFYNVLLDTVPFTSEAQLISPNNESRTYYEECCKRWAGDGEALERRLEDYHRRHMHDAEVVQHSLMAMQRNYHVDGGDVVARGDDAGAAAVEQLLQLPPRRPLNADQQRVVDAILAEPHGLHIVIGGPGTGKSYLLDALAIELQHAGKAVMKSATTGIAATRIADAGTVHSNYRINFDRRRYFSTGLDPTGKDVQRLRAISVGIIDEAFMMDTNVLAAVVGRLEGACNDTAPGAWAREKLLVLIGDDMQLPPVCRCRGPRDDEDEADRDLEGCERCHHLVFMDGDYIDAMLRCNPVERACHGPTTSAPRKRAPAHRQRTKKISGERRTSKHTNRQRTKKISGERH